MTARFWALRIDQATWAEWTPAQVLARFAEGFVDFLDLENSTTSIAVPTVTSHD